MAVANTLAYYDPATHQYTPELQANVRLGLKWPIIASALAYCTTIKSFEVLWANIINFLP
jgi:hypothetical protein